MTRGKRIILSDGRSCIWVWVVSFLGIALLSLSGCLIDPYENFKEIMNSEVEHSVDTDAQHTFRANPADIRTLPNGNLEYRYVGKNFRGICKYIFEVDKTTRKVIAWRYDGEDMDKACFVNP
jgi:hypothetical protein